MSFLNHDKAIITSMVQGDNPEYVKKLMDKSLSCGAEAFGMQFERMNPRFRTKAHYKDLFAYAKGKSVYVTNYRSVYNEGKSDELLSEELKEMALCGATLCDVMGDYFDKQPEELTMDKTAVEKQKELIKELHNIGAEVLMSSHILKYTPAKRVLEVALEHQKRGADISKIVTDAATMEEQLENLKIINLLKENLEIPFLFLCSGECSILRKIGGELGCCMYLGVYEHDEFATSTQPLLKNIKAVRENI